MKKLLKRIFDWFTKTELSDSAYHFVMREKFKKEAEELIKSK